jgi:outer membrane immunogenic protein
MKNLLLAGAVCALVPTSALAFDLGSGTGTWDRTYVGAQLGIAGLNSDWTIDDWVFFNPAIADVELADQGFVAGVFVGHDVELDGFVLGAEADFNFMDLGDSASFSGLTVGAEGLTIHASLGAVGSLRGRIGVPMDNQLFYVTAGIAAGTATVGYESESILLVGSDEHELKFGGVIGAGVEAMLTDTVSARLQGLYYNFGSYTFEEADTSYKADASAFTLTAGLSWNF